MSISSWVSMLVAVALTGCSTAPKVAKPAVATPAAPQVEKGMTSVTGKDGSFTVSVPDTWTVASSKNPKFVEAVKKAGQSEILGQIDQLTKQSYFRLMVMDLKGIESKAAFVDNLNVVVLPLGSPEEGKDMKAAAKASADQVFQPGTYSISVLDTPNGKVGKYSGPNGIGTGTKHDLIGAVLVHKGEVMTVSLSTRLGNGKNLNKTFNSIVNSIRFK